MPQISAIIPAYNRAHLVGRAVSSALEQTMPPNEIIVVDDGSTDETREVVERFGDEVRYIFQPNAGASAARNKGVNAASGEWLAFLDSDDVWMRDYLERISAAIETTSGFADTYFADLSDEGRSETVWERSGFAIDSAFELSADPSEWFLRPLQPMTTQATVIRRASYLEVGGQRPEILCREDTHLFFLLGFSGPSCAVQGVGAILGASGKERLTAAHAAETLSYCQHTIMLYRDVIHGHRGHLPTRHRRELRRRLARAYWQEGLLKMKDGSIATPLPLLRAAFLSPQLMAEKLRAAFALLT